MNSKVRQTIYVAAFLAIEGLVLYYLRPDILTLIGTVSGVLCVTTLVFRNWITFIFSMISNVCFLILGISNGIYSEIIQQPMFFILALLGLISWLSGKENLLSGFLARAKANTILILAILLMVVWSFISYRLGSHVYIRDGIMGGLALASQTLEIGKNKLSWVGWFLLNGISVTTWISVGNMAMAFMYILYLLNSAYGFIRWNLNSKSEMQNNFSS